MNGRIIFILILIAILFLGMFDSTLFAMGDSTSQASQLTIDYRKDELNLRLNYNDIRHRLEVFCPELVATSDEIRLSDDILFNSEGLLWDETLIPYELLNLSDMKMVSKHRVKIQFDIRSKPPRRRIPSDITTAFELVNVKSDQFVRGDVFCVGGDVEIYGEVSKNVVCLYGDVTIHSKGVVRGNVVAICGRVFRHEDSQVYGQVISEEGWEKGGHKWGSRRGYARDFSLGLGGDYNRVDGLYLMTDFGYEDPDEVFPKVRVEFGYAFEAERIRYEVAASQHILDRYALEPYGRLYRETATEDEWIISGAENAAMALLVNEDFRDYYEREGGQVGLKFYLGPYNTIDFSYSYDDLNPMQAHKLLWSLFGKKEFRENFSTLPYDLKQTYASDFDSKQSLFKINYEFNTRLGYYDKGANWHGFIDFEKAGGDLKGDLTYSRWTIGLTRYQPFNKYLALNLRVVYGGSSDRLPLHKKFFLGGLRTLRGYRHKEFYGDQMFLGNAEYVISFNRTLDAVLFFDIGKVLGQKENIWNDGEFKSDIGIAAELGPGFRVELAKALDKSDSDIRLWVLFSKPF